MRLGWVALLVAGATGADIATKAWARATLVSGEPALDLLPFLSLLLFFNEGVSFSLLAFPDGAAGPLIVALTAVLTLAAGTWAVLAGGARRFALTLITAGALGNLLDRSVHGRVTDFLLLHSGGMSLFVFNVADLCIAGGATVLVMGQLAAWKAPLRQP